MTTQTSLRADFGKHAILYTEHQKWCLPRSNLADRGPFYEEVLKSGDLQDGMPAVDMDAAVAKSAVPKSSVLTYIHYLQSGQVIPEVFITDNTARLILSRTILICIDAYALAMGIGDRKAQNDFMDVIQDELRRSSKLLTGRVSLRAVVMEIYKATKPGDPLRKLLIDLHLDTPGVKLDNLGDDADHNDFLRELIAEWHVRSGYSESVWLRSRARACLAEYQRQNPQVAASQAMANRGACACHLHNTDEDVHCESRKRKRAQEDVGGK